MEPLEAMLSEIREGQNEIKHEVIALVGQTESLTRQVALTNGKVLHLETGLRTLQDARLVSDTIAAEKARASPQQPAQTSDIVISKKMATALLTGSGTLLLVLAEAARQYFSGG